MNNQRIQQGLRRLARTVQEMLTVREQSVAVAKVPVRSRPVPVLRKR